MKTNKEKHVVDQAEELLKSPYSIAPGPEAETAIPIIKGLLDEVKHLRCREMALLRRIVALETIL